MSWAVVRPTNGCRAVWPACSVRATTALMSSMSNTSQPVAMAGSSLRTSSTVARLNDDTITSAVRPRACTARTTPSTTPFVGSKSGSPGMFLISMFTVMPSHASRASSRRRHGGRQLDAEALDDGATVFEAGVVVHHEDAVGAAPDVELHAVGAAEAGGPEGRDGVLGELARDPAVGEDRRGGSVGHDGLARLRDGTGSTQPAGSMAQWRRPATGPPGRPSAAVRRMSHQSEQSC